jgi:hypothetical protein
MSFHDAMFSFTGWVQTWFYILGVAMVATPILLAFSKATRRDALIVLLTNIVVVATMGWLYEQMGYVRMLGIIHVVFWTPLAVYLWRRGMNSEITLPFRIVIWLFVAALLFSLVFDYMDVVRYLMGERASLLK